MRISDNQTINKKIISGLGFAALVVLTALFSTGCNQDGVGIYYAISQEEKQLTSKISELPVHQVVEANGTVYVLTGRTIWEQNGDSWDDIGGGYAYEMVSYNTDVYAFFNYDDNDMDEGEIKSWNGSSWASIYTIDADADLFNIDGAYALEVGGGGTTDSVRTTVDFSTYTTESNFTDDVFDGTFNGTDYYLISKNSIYSGTPLGTLDTHAGVSGKEYKAITASGTDIYLISSDNTIYLWNGSSWDSKGSVGDDVVDGSLAVVNIDTLDYLIIGTENGYYEMEVGSSTVVGPTQTAATSTPEAFAANYPDLAQALVYEVYPSATSGVFYLATQNGLWKRTTGGEFQRQ